MKQEFNKKMAIVVNKNLESWQVLNTVSRIAAYLGNKMKDRFDTGEYFQTKDNKNHPIKWMMRLSTWELVYLEKMKKLESLQKNSAFGSNFLLDGKVIL